MWIPLLLAFSIIPFSAAILPPCVSEWTSDSAPSFFQLFIQKINPWSLRRGRILWRDRDVCDIFCNPRDVVLKSLCDRCCTRANGGNVTSNTQGNATQPAVDQLPPAPAPPSSLFQQVPLGATLSITIGVQPPPGAQTTSAAPPPTSSGQSTSSSQPVTSTQSTSSTTSSAAATADVTPSSTISQ